MNIETLGIKKKRNKRSAPLIFVYACNYSNILYCAPIRQKSNPRNNRKIIHHDKLRRATYPVATCSDVDSCEYKVLHIFDIVQHSVITINVHDTLPLCWHGNSICLRKFYIVDLGLHEYIFHVSDVTFLIPHVWRFRYALKDNC